MPAVPVPRVKMRAATRRLPRAPQGDAKPETEPEPNMRLSRALLVMLLLHVVAVGGVLAFSLIKERGPKPAPTDAAAPAEAEDLQVPVKAPMTDNNHGKADPRPGFHVVRQGETLTRIANEYGITLESLVSANGASTATNALHPGQELKLPDKTAPPAPKAAPTPKPGGPMSEALQLIEGKAAATPPPANKASHLPDSGQTYTVGKGETAYAIAHKLKVNEAALLKLNQIDDPKKLKPGQKLRLPPKTTG